VLTRSRPGPAVTLRPMLRLKHALRLGREVGHYAAANRLWWMLPVMVGMVLLSLSVAATQVAVPVAVYTLF
jgi:hypothetical protein